MPAVCSGENLQDIRTPELSHVRIRKPDLLRSQLVELVDVYRTRFAWTDTQVGHGCEAPFASVGERITPDQGRAVIRIVLITLRYIPAKREILAKAYWDPEANRKKLASIPHFPQGIDTDMECESCDSMAIVI